MHHCVTSVKKEVLPVLEKDLEEQVEVVRETERKKKKEEEAKKVEEAAKKDKAKGEVEFSYMRLRRWCIWKSNARFDMVWCGVVWCEEVKETLRCQDEKATTMSKKP